MLAGDTKLSTVALGIVYMHCARDKIGAAKAITYRFDLHRRPSHQGGVATTGSFRLDEAPGLLVRYRLCQLIGCRLGTDGPVDHQGLSVQLKGAVRQFTAALGLSYPGRAL